VTFGPGSTRSLAIRTLLAFSALVVVLGLWHGALPVFGPVIYQYDNAAPKTAALPLSVPTVGKKLRLHTTVQVARVHPTLFTVVPDDCLERLVVNGSEVPVYGSICYDRGGARISLLGRLHPGVNTVDMEVVDNGGRGGLEMGVSIADPLFQILVALGLLLLFAGAASVVQRSASPRVGYAALFVMASTLAVRLPLVLAPGYPADVGLFTGWAKSAVELGTGASYLQQVGKVSLPNYPPFSMEMLAVTARAYRWLIDPVLDAKMPDFAAFLKVPAIVADAITAVLLFFLVRRLRGGRLASALAAGLAYALHPAVVYDSAIWGQVDSLFCVLALAALAAAVAKRFALAGALAAVALLTKLQAFVILPTLGLLLLLERRALVRAILGGAAAAAAILVPMASLPVLRAIKGVYLHSAGFYPVVSMYAFNLWVALFGVKEQGRSDQTMLFGLASYRNVGLALFLAFALGMPLFWWRKLRSALEEPERASIVFLVPALTASAFFLFNTEMHERYLFPMMALGLPLLVISRAGRFTYIASSVLFLLNLLGSFPWSNVDRMMFRDLPNLPAAIGACHVFAFAATVRIVHRRA
jgi:hypothetical protein